MSAPWIVAFVAQWIVLLVVGFLLAGALREIGLLHLRVRESGAMISEDGLERGVHAPDFTAVDAVTGQLQSVHDLPSVDRVLLFISPGCISCSKLAKQIDSITKARPEFDYLVVCTGKMQACRDFLAEAALSVRTLIDESSNAEQLYEVMGTPFGYLIDAKGRVLIRGVVNDARQLESLLDQEGSLEPGGSANDEQPHGHPPNGQSAPTAPVSSHQ